MDEKPPVASSPQQPSLLTLLKEWKNAKILWIVFSVMMLAINGGSVLPVAATFASTGLISATVLMVVVALVNIYTNDMLLWQCLATKQNDYETLSGAVGGKVYKVLTEVSLVTLMLGTMVASIQQVGGTTSAAITFLSPSYKGILTDGSGRLLMAISVVAICAPLVFLKGMKQLESAGDIGIVINQVVVIVVVVNVIQHDFPELGVKGALMSLLGTYSYLFYIQPFSLAMFSEMPAGTRGVRLLSLGTNMSIIGTGIFVYWMLGFAGASRFGASAIDVGNILQNNLGGNGKGQGALNLLYTIYIVLSTPPFEYVCRHSEMKWWDSLAVRYKYMDVRPMARKLVLATFNYSLCLGIALAIPGGSALVISITGAVCSALVCFIIPVINHFLLYYGYAKCSRASIRVNEEKNIELEMDTPPVTKLGGSVGDENDTEIIEVENSYTYPTHAAAEFGFKMIVLHNGLPFCVIVVGFFITVATLVSI